MVAKGCDGMLFSLIEDLYKVGILRKAGQARVWLMEGMCYSKEETINFDGLLA
jgi:hypothetical protein